MISIYLFENEPPFIVENNKIYLTEYQNNGIKEGDKNGWTGGLIFPYDSQAGERIEAVIKIATTEKSYGAVLQFTVQAGENGLEPADVSIQALSTQ